MKKTLICLLIIAVAISCHRNVDKDKVKEEILKTEKAFEKMTSEKGVAEAFYYFADEKAVIRRENDTLIEGKNNIKTYYEGKHLDNAIVLWTPDYIEVSDCGTLGYSYGKYAWKITDKDGAVSEYKGIYLTVWKKQKDNSWKYIWD